MKYPLDFYTQYSQFYIYDKGSTDDRGSDKSWTNEAFNDRLVIGEGILVVLTECYGPIKGEFCLLIHSEKNLNFDDYDHIVEGGIEIKSGTIQILDCPNSIVELELAVTPGAYRARIYSLNLKSVDGDEGDDFYRIEIWPDTKMERTVLKRYNQR